MSQKEQLQIEIESLVARKESLSERLGTTNETAMYHDIHNELTVVTNELDQLIIKRDELEQQEAAGITAQQEVSNQFANISFGEGVSIALRDLCLNEETYQLVSEYIQRTVGDMAQNHAALASSYKSEIESQEDTIQKLEEYRREVNRVGELLADMTARRDAAAKELLHANEEISRLTKDNESLRNQFEIKQPTNSPKINAAEIIRKIQAAKPGIYNKRWKINDRGLEDRRYFTANLSETGEELHIPILDIGKYREESAEDAARFRQEMAIKEMEQLDQETINHVEAPSLPESDAEVSSKPVDGEVAHETVSRAEHKALRKEVTMIAAELKARGILPHNWEAVEQQGVARGAA